MPTHRSIYKSSIRCNLVFSTKLDIPLTLTFNRCCFPYQLMRSRSRTQFQHFINLSLFKCTNQKRRTFQPLFMFGFHNSIFGIGVFKHKIFILLCTANTSESTFTEVPYFYKTHFRYKIQILAETWQILAPFCMTLWVQGQ